MIYLSYCHATNLSLIKNYNNMLYYLIILAITFIISICSTDKHANRAYILYFGLLAVIVLSAFGGTRLIGLDYDTYEIHFNSVPTITKYEWTDPSMEIGYEILVSLCKSLYNSFHLFLILFTALTITLILWLCYKYSPYPLLSFFMFFSYSFFPQVMGQMRQPLAIALAFIISIPLLLKSNKRLACISLICIAFLFHKSILFLIPFILFYDKTLSTKKIVLFSSIAITCYILSGVLTPFLISLIPSGFYLHDAAVAYLTYKSMAVTFSMGMLERIAMVTILFYYSYKYNLYQKNHQLRLFINMYFIGVCIYFTFISISAEFASRGTQAFTYALFFALPIILKQVNLKDKYILLSIICAWGIYLSLGILDNANEYIPYKSILF